MQNVRRLARNTWVPLTLAGVLVVGVVLAVPWYYRTFRGVEPARGLDGPELAWVASWARWHSETREALAAAFEARTALDGALEPSLTAGARCEETIETLRDTPPRLVEALEQGQRTCGLAAGALTAFRSSGDLPNRLTSAQLGAALRTLAEGDRLMRRLLLTEQPLPEATGPDVAESRVDPLLAGAASGEQPVDVRCWSRADWPAVRRELEAVGREAGAGLAYAYRFAVHLSPAACEELLRVAHGRVEPGAETAEPLVALLRGARIVLGIPAGCVAAEAETAAGRLGLPEPASRALAAHAREQQDPACR